MKKLLYVILLLYIMTSCSIEKVEAKKSLAESIILIDPGHGGKDNGASYGELIEDELNLEISFLISDYLIDKGATVYFTRTGDYDLSSNSASNKKKDDLKERLRIIHNYKPDLFISIHMNTYPSMNVNGAQVFYYKENLLANCIQKELNVLNNKEKKIKKDDIYLLKNSLIPCCLIECGFVTGNIDYQNFQNKEYKKEVAIKICEGIENYLLIKQ